MPWSKGARLGWLSWDEAESALAAGLPVILPVGAGCKEHGLHLPLETDRLLADYLTARVLEQVPALALPTLTYGYYPAFLEYPGSVSLPAETFRDLVAAIFRSLHSQGARRFYVLNTGISTLRPLAAARDLLLQEGVRMSFTDLGAALGELERGLAEQPGGTHADEMETSMMLVIAPERVRLDRARPDYHGAGPGPLTRNPSGPGLYSPTGAWGDPTLATAEKGRLLLDALVAHLVAEVGRC